MKIKYLLVAALATIVSGSAAMAQPPGGQGGPGGHGGPGGPPPNPVMEALDSDGNHELSAAEINNATNALKALDKNGDGMLNEADLGRMGPPHGGGGPGGPPMGGQGGPNSGRPGADRGQQTDDFASRLLAFDKNENGSIEKDELPERMQRILARVDSNKDNVIDAAEIENMKSSAAESGNAQGQGQRGQRGGRGGEAGGRQGRGGPGGAGGPGGPGGPGGRGGPPQDGARGGGPGGAGGRGGPDPARFIEHAMTFDVDGDGLLSKTELTKFASEMGGPSGSGGRGGMQGGGRGGQRPGAGGGGRGGRPN